nr:ankyrin repeat domain containing protein [Mimivirus sp.]
MVKYLVEKGADINADDHFVITYAACNGHLEMVKYLVEKRANINANDHFAYRMAKLNKHNDVVQYLESLMINIDFINIWYGFYYNPISPINSKLLRKNFRKITKEMTKSIIKTKREVLDDFETGGVNINVINYNYH